MKANKSNPKSIVLFCFLIAGVWAGSIVTYAVVSQSEKGSTAELYLTDNQVADNQAAFGDRLRNRKKKNRDQDTEPYVEETAPKLNAEQESPGTDFQFKFAEAVAPDEAKESTDKSSEPANDIEATLDSVQRLFSGEGSFQDIIKIGIAAFALFGGTQFGASDGLFKIILSLFSKKANFNAILEEKLQQNGGTTRRSRRRSRQ